MSSAAHLVCSSPKHEGKVANIALVGRRAVGWVPIRPENMAGRNPRFRGVDKPGSWESVRVISSEDDSDEAGIMRAFGVPSADTPTHTLYRFRCPLCRYTLPVTGANLDAALDDLTASGEWRVSLHDLSAKVSGK